LARVIGEVASLNDPAKFNTDFRSEQVVLIAIDSL